MQQQPVVSPDGVQMMPPPGTVVVPQGLPPGLAYLQSLDTINIHQVFDIVEGMFISFCNADFEPPYFLLLCLQIAKSQRVNK